MTSKYTLEEFMSDNIHKFQTWPIASLLVKIDIGIENISVFADVEKLITSFTSQMRSGGAGEGEYFVNSTLKKKIKIVH